MSKYIKLKDKGTIFHDAGQDATVTGEQVIEVKETAKVRSALKGGVIVEATKAEFDSANSTKKTKAAAPKVTADGGDDADKPVDYTKLKKEQLNAELDARGIEHDPEAVNADLVALLVADDEAKTVEK